MTESEWFEQLFNRLSHSKFRSRFHLKQKDTRFACFFLLSRQSPRSRASPDFGSLLAKIPELNNFHSSRVFFYKFSFPPSRGLTSISITQSPT